MNGYRYYKVLDVDYNDTGILIPDATDGRKALKIARESLRDKGIEKGYLEFNVVTDDGCDNIDHITEIVITRQSNNINH